MNLKKYLPFENYVLLTSLPVDEVIHRLALHIEPKKPFKFFRLTNTYTKDFIGNITGRKFFMNRNINYRNSFFPVINGEIFSVAQGTAIKINMRPLTAVLVFMSFWLGTVGLVCIGMLVAAVSQLTEIIQEGFSPVIFIPFVLFLFGYLLLTIGFKVESKTSKKILEKLLEGKETNSLPVL